jgi:ribosomal protein S15P/S13E
LEKNNKDYQNKRALATVESKIHRLVKYYKVQGKLQPEWEYKPMAASVA